MNWLTISAPFSALAVKEIVFPPTAAGFQNFLSAEELSVNRSIAPVIAASFSALTIPDLHFSARSLGDSISRLPHGFFLLNLEPCLRLGGIARVVYRTFPNISVALFVSFALFNVCLSKKISVCCCPPLDCSLKRVLPLDLIFVAIDITFFVRFTYLFSARCVRSDDAFEVFSILDFCACYG